MTYIKPAWFLNNKFEKESNLFTLSNIETEYSTYSYLCHCKRVQNIVGTSKPEYKCKCGNSTFIDAKKAVKDFKGFISYLYHNKKIKINFDLHHKIDIIDNKVQAIFYTNVPVYIDENIKKCIYKEFVIASVTPSKTKNELKIPKEFSKEIKPRLLKMLEDREIFENHINSTLLSRRGSKIREKQIDFFLNHHNLKDKEFLTWSNGDLLKGDNLSIQKALIELAANKKSKSVKKAIFKCYEFQMNDTKKFNPLLIYIATNKFSDLNFIVNIIELFHINNDKYLSKLERVVLFEFIDFLLKTYTQKQVYIFLKNFENFINLDKNNFKRAYIVFQDILNQFKIIKLDLTNDFKKVKCTPRGIHDEFVRILNSKKYKHLQNKTLNYTDAEYNALVQIGEYEVKLPKTGAELYCWADDLHNCMASYLDRLEKKQTIIYGFFKGVKIQFGLEVKDNQIIQAYRSYNRDLSLDEKILLNDWYRNIYLKH